MLSLSTRLQNRTYFRFKRRETDPDDVGFRNLWRFMAYMKPYRTLIIVAGVAGMLRMITPMFMPYYVGQVMDNVLKAGGTRGERLHILWNLTFIFLGLLVMHAAATLGRVYWGNVVAANTERDVRHHLFNHVQRLSLEFHMQRPTGTIVSRVMGDVSSAQQSFDYLYIQGSQNLLQAVVVIAYLAYTDWQWALVSLATIPVFVFTTRMMRTRVRKASRQVMETGSRIHGHMQERIAMIREVQSFNAEDREHRRIQGQVHVLRGYTMRRFFLSSLMIMSSEITRTLGLLVVIVFGAYRVLDGTATPGDVTSFFLYIGLLLTPMEFFANLYTNLTQSAVAADRIFEFLDTRSPIQDAPNARDLQVNGPPPVVFENVKFAYPDAPDVTVLKGISFEARPGDRVVLVGGSGSGKSSMMNLLMRFYDVSDGAIRINGQDLRLITTHSLRDHIGIVPQQPILFRGTLRDNILYGRRGASDEELHDAARQANAEKFILDFPNGYDTLIGERGARLSGGQAQRIAIARAFLKNPDILIMDEATSNLDATSETLVLEALDRLAEGRTTFIIAHRLSVARTANLIIVMNKGEIVERGTHEELLAKPGHYADLWNQQMLGRAREEVMFHDNL
jgi:ABC-type multidrug transport system fused ATPase/permease subunit